MSAKLPDTIVQKFGGSSLATQELRLAAAARVIEALHSGFSPVVVVSAIGRSPAPYATDTLLALSGDAEGANRDIVLACGELISAGIFAGLLESHGVPAQALTGGQAGIVTNNVHEDADIQDVRIDVLWALLKRRIVPVVAGFQGMTADGAITTIGRGGSDLTAVALAWALGNAPLEIYTDVDGVCTSDPHTTPDAQTISHMSFEELCHLARSGARVMQAKAIESAQKTRTALQILGLRTRIGTKVGYEDG